MALWLYGHSIMPQNKTKKYNNTGFSLIELMVSIFLISLIFLSFYQLFINTMAASSRTEIKSRAYFLAQDAIEVSKNIRDRKWDEIENLTLATVYHPEEQDGEWKMIADSETIDSIYTREVVFGSVLRDVGGDIVQSGGTADPHMRQVTATVSWQGKDNTRQVTLSNYLTNWKYMNNFVKYFTQTNQSDFEASGSYTVDTETYPGSLALTHDVLYEQDFGSGQPADWVDSRNLNIDNDLYLTTDIGGNTVLYTDSNKNDVFSHYVNATTDTWTYYQFSGRLMIDTATGGIGLVYFSDFMDSTKHYRLKSENGGTFEIHAIGTSITPRGIDDRDSGVSPTPGQWYRFKIYIHNVDEQATMLAKIWPDGDDEPASWQVDCFDENSSYATNGTVGFWTKGNATKYFDDVKVEGLSDFDNTGQLTSQPYDTGTSSDFGIISWSAEKPSGTTVRLQLRSAPDSSGSPGTWTDWLGPTGTGDYYETDPNGEIINSTHDNDQWIQYQVTMTTSDTSITPVFKEVSISYSNQLLALSFEL